MDHASVNAVMTAICDSMSKVLSRVRFLREFNVDTALLLGRNEFKTTLGPDRVSHEVITEEITDTVRVDKSLDERRMVNNYVELRDRMSAVVNILNQQISARDDDHIILNANQSGLSTASLDAHDNLFINRPSPKLATPRSFVRRATSDTHTLTTAMAGRIKSRVGMDLSPSQASSRRTVVNTEAEIGSCDAKISNIAAPRLSTGLKLVAVVQATKKTVTYDPTATVGAFLNKFTCRPSCSQRFHCRYVVEKLPVCGLAIGFVGFALSFWNVIPRKYSWLILMTYPYIMMLWSSMNLRLLRQLVKQQTFWVLNMWNLMLFACLASLKYHTGWNVGLLIGILTISLCVTTVSLSDTMPISNRIASARILLPICVILLVLTWISLHFNWLNAEDVTTEDFVAGYRLSVTAFSLATTAITNITIQIVHTAISLFIHPEQLALIKSPTEVKLMSSTEAHTLSALQKMKTEMLNVSKKVIESAAIKGSSSIAPEEAEGDAEVKVPHIGPATPEELISSAISSLDILLHLFQNMSSEVARACMKDHGKYSAIRRELIRVLDAWLQQSRSMRKESAVPLAATSTASFRGDITRGVLQVVTPTKLYDPEDVTGKHFFGKKFSPDTRLFRILVLVSMLVFIPCLAAFLAAFVNFIPRAYTRFSFLCYPYLILRWSSLNMIILRDLVKQTNFLVINWWNLVLFLCLIVVRYRSTEYYGCVANGFVIILLAIFIATVSDSAPVKSRRTVSSIIFPISLLFLVFLWLAVVYNWVDADDRTFTVMGNLRYSAFGNSSTAVVNIVIVFGQNIWNTFRYRNQLVVLMSRMEVLVVEENQAIALHALDHVKQDAMQLVG